MRARLLAVLLASLFSACAPDGISEVADTSSAFLSEQEFENELIGKTISWVDDTGEPNEKVRISIQAGGTWSGRGRFDDDLKGEWRWEGNYWCRTLSGVTENAPADDCLLLRRDQQDYLFIRDRGKGIAIRYRIVS